MSFKPFRLHFFQNRRLTQAVAGSGSASAASPSPLKYSDYLQIATIIFSGLATLSAFHFIVEYNPDLIGAFAGIATIAAMVGQFLQSKGD